MSNWINVAHINDIPIGTWQTVDLDNLSILVININNQFYAIENLCTHDGGPLSDGQLEGEEIVCSRHGAKFCVKNGTVTAPPAYEDIRTFPVKVENEIIKINPER